MARSTRLTASGEQIAGRFDLDASISEFLPCRSERSIATKSGPLADDPIPLFLSGHAEQPKQPGLGKARDRAVISSRVLKTSILAVTAAAIIFAVLSVENPFALFANAKASLIGASAAQPSIKPTKSTREPTLAEPLASIAQPMPTRAEIAAALRTAQQSQVEIRQPPAAAPPARRLEADELAALLKRARSLIAIGDIAAARLLLERAADAQEAGAALLLAQTYDPAVLGTPDARSITPDPAAARAWYQKAAQLGSRDAQQRLAQMQN
jgi:TPR repeat protein